MSVILIDVACCFQLITPAVSKLNCCKLHYTEPIYLLWTSPTTYCIGRCTYNITTVESSQWAAAQQSILLWDWAQITFCSSARPSRWRLRLQTVTFCHRIHSGAEGSWRYQGSVTETSPLCRRGVGVSAPSRVIAVCQRAEPSLTQGVCRLSEWLSAQLVFGKLPLCLQSRPNCRTDPVQAIKAIKGVLLVNQQPK